MEPNDPYCPVQGHGWIDGQLPAQVIGPDPVFTPALKLRFLDELSRHGNVRVATQRVGVSRSGAYLARRRDAGFDQGWRSALVLARDHVEAVLAERALEGVEEPIFYRGEQIGSRRRFDTRLLLAHLARLDTLCADEAIIMAVEDERELTRDFDRTLARIGDLDEAWGYPEGENRADAREQAHWGASGGRDKQLAAMEEAGDAWDSAEDALLMAVDAVLQGAVPDAVPDVVGSWPDDVTAAEPLLEFKSIMPRARSPGAFASSGDTNRLDKGARRCRTPAAGRTGNSPFCTLSIVSSAAERHIADRTIREAKRWV